MDFDTLVGGHVARTGTRERRAAPGDPRRSQVRSGDRPEDGETGRRPRTSRPQHTWGLFDNYIDRVALACVNQLTPKWSSRLAAYDVYIWDQCYSMEQSLRID